MDEIHLVKSIIWMGQKNKHTHKKKHDDMLSCCATKKLGLVQLDKITNQLTADAFLAGALAINRTVLFGRILDLDSWDKK